jgi:hypothetical protein
MHACMRSDYCEACTGQYVGTFAVIRCSILDTPNIHILPQIPVHSSHVLLVSLQQLRPNLAFSRRESYHLTLINQAPNVLGLS